MPSRVPSLLTLAADACADALKRGDSRVIAGLGDLHSDCAELIAVSYFPLSSSSRRFLPALRALAESNALSPRSLTLSTRELSRSGLEYIHLASHSLTHLEIVDCPWLDTLEPWIRTLPRLKCLSLSGCVGLPPEALAALAPMDDASQRNDAHDASNGNCNGNGRDAMTRGNRRGRRQRRSDVDDEGYRCGDRGGGSGGSDGWKGEPPKLVTLDLSRCASMTDAAGPHLARISSTIEHLDLSHCPVGNLLLDFLTYKVRLKRWREQQRQQQRQQQQQHEGWAQQRQQSAFGTGKHHPAALAAMEMSGMRMGMMETGDEQQEATPIVIGGVSDANAAAAAAAEEAKEAEADEREECSIHDLRLRGTSVSDFGVSNLHALRRITLLDLSLCAGVKCASLQPLARAHGLTATRPEDKRILTQSNAIAASWQPAPAPSTPRHSFLSSSCPDHQPSSFTSTSTFAAARLSPSTSSSSSSSRGPAGSCLRGMCVGCCGGAASATACDGNNGVGVVVGGGCGGGGVGNSGNGNGNGNGSLAEEGWCVFLCAIREEEEREETERRDAAAAAEREVLATAARMFHERSGGIFLGGGGRGWQNSMEIPGMFPIGPPPSTHPQPSSGSPDPKVRRTSYLIG